MENRKGMGKRTGGSRVEESLRKGLGGGREGLSNPQHRASDEGSRRASGLPGQGGERQR